MQSEATFHEAVPLAQMLGLIRPAVYAAKFNAGATLWTKCKKTNADGSCAGHISAVPVVRGADGSFEHPDVPNFAESEITINEWLEIEGLDVEIVHAHWGKARPTLREWNPTPPDARWFLLILIDTCDGPIAWFVKQKD